MNEQDLIRKVASMDEVDFVDLLNEKLTDLHGGNSFDYQMMPDGVKKAVHKVTKEGLTDLLMIVRARRQTFATER